MEYRHPIKHVGSCFIGTLVLPIYCLVLNIFEWVWILVRNYELCTIMYLKSENCQNSDRKPATPEVVIKRQEIRMHSSRLRVMSYEVETPREKNPVLL